MPGEVTRLGFRLEPRFFDALDLDDVRSLVGAEFPVTWGEHEAQGKVTGVEDDGQGYLLTMEVSADTDFPAFPEY